MTARTFLLLAVLALVACGETPTETDGPVLGEATVVLDEASLGYQGSSEVIAAALRNTGRAGSFKMEAWGLPTTPNGPNTLYGKTDETLVAAGWKQTLSFSVNTGTFSGTHRIKTIVVYSRDDQNVVWRETGRKTF